MSKFFIMYLIVRPVWRSVGGRREAVRENAGHAGKSRKPCRAPRVLHRSASRVRALAVADRGVMQSVAYSATCLTYSVSA